MTPRKKKKTIRAAHWKRSSTMDEDKYKVVSRAILKSLGAKGMRYMELTDRVYLQLKNFKGSLWHYILRCLRELETQGKVVRDLGPPVLYSKKLKRRKRR